MCKDKNSKPLECQIWFLPPFNLIGVVFPCHPDPQSNGDK